MREIKAKIHRIMAPRLVFMVGTTSQDGKKNIIPISNATSISTEPGMAMIAIYHPWVTADNLKFAKGFTLSLPSKDQLELVWKMAPKYSGYETELEKTDEFKNDIDINFSEYGPVLKNALGWIECEIVARPEIAQSNHLLVIGQYTKAMVDEKKYTDEVSPIGQPKPLMQWEQNKFSTAESTFDIPYYKGPHR